MRSVVDRNVVMRRTTVLASCALYREGESCNTCIENYFQSVGYNRYIDKDVDDTCVEVHQKQHCCFITIPIAAFRIFLHLTKL